MLVLRIWIERVAGNQLRARITEVTDLESGEQTTVVVAEIDQIVDIVHDFVHRFRRDATVTRT